MPSQLVKRPMEADTADGQRDQPSSVKQQQLMNAFRAFASKEMKDALVKLQALSRVQLPAPLDLCIAANGGGSDASENA